MDGSGDHCLVKRGAAGDREAFATLVARYLEAIWTLIRYRVGNPASAEDVLQETLLLAWMRLPQLRDPGRIKAWLVRIAQNECTRYHQRKGARELPAAELPAVTASRYGRGTYSDELAAEIDLADAIAGLPEAHQELVKGFYVEGFSLGELARRGRYPVGTAKSRLYSARNHLRKVLEE